MSRVFRKVALDRLSSPDQLDQVMRVVNPRGWVALVGVGCLLLFGLAWGIAGRLSETVLGRGILVKSGGVLEVVAPASGMVADVSVSVGDSVRAGQTVAWLAQPELSERLQDARERLAALRMDHDLLVAFVNEDARLQLANVAQQRSNIEVSIDAAEEAARWQRERLEAQEQLHSQGLITRTALLATRQQLDQTEEQIRAAQAQLVQLEARRLEVRNRGEERVRDSESAIATARMEVERLERELRFSSAIVSQYTGTILELMTEPGNIIQRGEPAATLDLTGQDVRDLTAIIYIPSVDGKKIRVGMPLQIAPTTVRPEEFGMMVGRVTFVSSYPATAAGMARVLKNERLVAELSGNGAPYEVHADLLVDPRTPSRFQWTSSSGPPTLIQSGTLAAAQVTVDTQRPLTRVIPLLRLWTGL